jgi:hypothetical protein
VQRVKSSQSTSSAKLSPIINNNSMGAPNEKDFSGAALKALESELGPGPMRFAPHGERTAQDQIDSLVGDDLKCFEALKKKWQKEYPDKPYTDSMILRFARCSPGEKKFNAKSSYKVMKNFDRRYLTLTAEALEDQLLSKVCARLCVFTYDYFFFKDCYSSPMSSCFSIMRADLVSSSGTQNDPRP